jgi:hypothetical protein
MTLADHQLARQKRIQASLIGLANDVRFRDFIEVVRECQTTALDNLTDGSVIANERASTACIGEIAAYRSIIRTYDEAVAQAAMAREEA